MRYGFIFKFKDGGWNIVLQEDGNNAYYFSCDEDDYNDALDMLDLFLQNGGDVYKYTIPTYEIFVSIVGDDDIFELPHKPVDGMDEYWDNPKHVTHYPCTNATNCPNCGSESVMENMETHCDECGYYFHFEINEGR